MSPNARACENFGRNIVSLSVMTQTPHKCETCKYDMNLICTLYVYILQGVNLEILDPWAFLTHSSVRRESLEPFGLKLMRSDLAHKSSSLPLIITKPVTIFL